MNTTVCAFYTSCSVSTDFCSAAGSSWSRWACGSWEGQERCKGTAFRCTLYTHHLCRRIYSCKWNRDIIIWYSHGRFQGGFWSSYTTYEKHWPALCLWKPSSIICSCMHLGIKSECRWYVHLLAPLVSALFLIISHNILCSTMTFAVRHYLYVTVPYRILFLYGHKWANCVRPSWLVDMQEMLLTALIDLRWLVA